MSTIPSDRLEVQVYINGGEVSGLLAASIITTNYFSADTYALTFAIDRSVSGNMAFWSSVSAAYVEVTAVASSAGRATRLITGMIDTMHVDLIQGSVAVEGRDLSSSMIDSYRQQDFVNQTASDMVSTIAVYHNLQPFVTVTSGNVGRYYGDGYTKLSLGQFSRVQSDWDFVVQLARQHSFDVFVEGRSLTFQPSSGLFDLPLPLSVNDVQRMRIERHLEIAAQSTARVQSWDSQNMTAYQSGYDSASAITDQGLSGTTLPFLFSASNYTSQQVTDSASQYTAELGRLGTVLHVDMPWDLKLSPRTIVLIEDTYSAFDTTYRIDSIERHFSSTCGSTQAIHASQI